MWGWKCVLYNLYVFKYFLLCFYHNVEQAGCLTETGVDIVMIIVLKFKFIMYNL